MIDPAFAATHSECYVAPGRRWTISSNDSLVVHQGGELVLVPNDAVEQAVQDGVLLGPGVPYVEPAGFNMGMPASGRASGVTKRIAGTTGFPTRKIVPLTVTAGSKTLTLPDTPSDSSSVVVTINERAYLPPAFTVSGATVTMNFVLLATDTVSAEYR